MSGAGLTRSGFYSYFKSKSDLYAEVLTCFFTDPNWKSCWEGVKVDLSSGDVGPQIVRAYLSRQHFENVEDSCPMVALPTDVARSGNSARSAFEAVFRSWSAYSSVASPRTAAPTAPPCKALPHRASEALVVARALVDRTLADELRDACMQVALDLGDWSKPAKSKNGKSKAAAASAK